MGEEPDRHAWLEPGVFEVAPGVHRIPLPLPMDGLRAVNVYAVETGNGLVMIDSGWALEVAERQLEQSLGTLGYEFGDVQRFLVTHIHRDHYTLAISLRRQATQMVRWGAAPLIAKWAETFGERDTEARDRYEEPDEWLDGKTTIELGDRTLTAVPTPGHTLGHTVFVDERAKVLFAGDHVLPHITPSIGFQPEPAKLPLGDYLDSLHLVRSYPDLRLLPAHGPVTDSTHTRVDELLAHHEERLAETLVAVRDGAGTAYEAARRLGWTRRHRRFDDLDLFNQTLAAGETAAHLDVLVLRGELSSSTVDGVVEYAPTPPASE